MQTVQIWKCQPCGARRVWGNAALPDLGANHAPLLLCDKGCSVRHVVHTFLGMEEREWTGVKWIRRVPAGVQ